MPRNAQDQYDRLPTRKQDDIDRYGGGDPETRGGPPATAPRPPRDGSDPSGGSAGPADLSGYRQPQTGNFPNSFVNLQAYLNANPVAPPATQTQPAGYYPQGQSNLDSMLRGAYYGSQASAPPGTAQGAAVPAPTPGTVPTATPAALTAAGPTGATPQPGSANPSGSLTGGQNQSVPNMATGTVYGSPTEKDRPFPRLQKYLG